MDHTVSGRLEKAQNDIGQVTKTSRLDQALSKKWISILFLIFGKCSVYERRSLLCGPAWYDSIINSENYLMQKADVSCVNSKFLKIDINAKLTQI